MGAHIYHYGVWKFLQHNIVYLLFFSFLFFKSTDRRSQIYIEVLYYAGLYFVKRVQSQGMFKQV